MKKIVQFVGLMDLGGAETLLMHIFRNIDREAYEFIFMENRVEKSYYADEILALDGKIVKTPEFSYRDAVHYYKWLVEWFKENQPDIVHSHTYLHSWIILAAAKRAGVKCRIAHAHSGMHKYDNGSWLKWKIQKKLLKHYATEFVACSEEAKRDMFEGDSRAVIIKNPVDLAQTKAAGVREVKSLRKKYDIGKDDIVIGHVGRLAPSKNHLFLVELARELVASGIKYKMIFAGDGELESEIRRKVEDYDLEDNIIFAGSVKTVPAHLAMFDVFVMPSLWEGLSLAALEAQASGVPCLFSNKVSREVKVNENVRFLQLDVGAWAENIKHNGKRIGREEAKKNIKEKGFGLQDVLERFRILYG
ncbi:glycosyltransferase [Candidatus Saccharibacteria bacterium]|nr:glycosyltransferase [Candidatus Saccharibacteria bacterium]